MVKIAFDAGHGINTAGKRTPDNEREWSFNDVVVRYAIALLRDYIGVETLRVDDITGRTDTPLAARTNQANDWKADAYISVHHNALNGKWGNHTGTETYIYPGSKPSRKLAESIHPQIVRKFKLKDRGIKEANFQVLRDTKMPAILIEGGYMDSSIDIIAMRDESRLKAQAEGIVLGLASHFDLKKKEVKGVTQPIQIVSETHAENWKRAKELGFFNGENPKNPITREQAATVAMRIYDKLNK